MKLDVLYTARETEDIKGQTVIVIDVLRASTTIVTALANGCPAVYAEESIEAALSRAKGRNDLLLCGERRGRKIEGFDLGNSPLEYTAESLKGRALVLTTSNGTMALHRAGNQDNVLIGSFINFEAVVKRALQLGNDITLLCAGDEGKFSYEDAFCAALMIRDMQRHEESVSLRDSARRALQILQDRGPFSEDELGMILKQTSHGKRLIRLGFIDDITYCAKMNLFGIVPVLKDDKLVI